MTLGEWPKDACGDNVSICEDVDQRLRDHADTEAMEVIANLVWQRVDGTVHSTKRLRCKPSISADPDDVAKAEALGIVGTREGWFLQMQRHHEVMVRSYFANHQTQIAQGLQMQRAQTELIGTLGGMLNEAWKGTHGAHLELDKLRNQQRNDLDRWFNEFQDLKEQAGTGQTEESAERTAIMQQVGEAMKVALPFLIQAVGRALTSGQAAPSEAAAPQAAE